MKIQNVATSQQLIVVQIVSWSMWEWGGGEGEKIKR